MLGGINDEAVRFKRVVGIVITSVLILLLELMNGPAPSQTHPPVEARISRNLRGHELESYDEIHGFATALIQFHSGIVAI